MKPSEQRLEAPSAPRRSGRGGGKSYQVEFGGKGMLGIFFALAVVCALFFSFGYTIGQHAIPSTFTLGSAPAASPRAEAPAPPAASGVAPPNPAQLGAAENNQTPATLTPEAAQGTGAAAQATAEQGTGAKDQGTGGQPAAAPTTATAASGGVFNVQVFAGTSTDAQSLASALKTKGYPAAVAAPAPNATDALYRVYVGPYMTAAEAEAMRSRLTADGYQAVVKSSN